MTESEIAKCRTRLEQFLADPLEPLGRRERRHWGSVYVRGLMLDGERKSIEPMAARLPEGNVQAMQQLIGQSPWLWAPVWQRLAQRMTAELRPDPVWVIDDTGFPKQGHHSVGVARQYSGTLGKTANCQVAVSLHQTAGEESTILDWRLYLPESWTQDPERRAAAGIPAEVKFQTKWELALELIDEAQKWGLRCGVVLADAGYGEVTEYRQGLETRQLPYAVGIPSTLGVWTKPPRIHKLKARGQGRPPSAYHYGPQRPGTVREVAQKARGWKQVRWREGSKGWLESRFYACRVQPCAWIPRGPTPAQGGLAAGGMAARREGTHETLSLRPAGALLVAAAGAHRQSPLEDRTGLSATQGGTGAGSLRRPQLGRWHHHVTLVMLAHAFLTLERLRSKKNFWVDPATDAP